MRMVARSIDERVTILEQKVAGLEELPGQMRELTAKVDDLSTSFLEFRTEIRAAFSAVATRTELYEVRDELRQEMRHLNDRTMTHARALYEELNERLKWIGEHRNGNAGM
jgi:hypothetical protein